MVTVPKWACPAEFLHVHWVFSVPNHCQSISRTCTCDLSHAQNILRATLGVARSRNLWATTISAQILGVVSSVAWGGSWFTLTMGAGMITQLIPQQLLMCNWCACNWILIPRAFLLCNCLSGISYRQNRQTPEIHTHYTN